MVVLVTVWNSVSVGCSSRRNDGGNITDGYGGTCSGGLRW